MSRAVVDSCVAVKWLVLEPGTDAADRLLEDYLRGEIELLAPETIGPEVGNALWVRFRRGLATAEATRFALDKFARLQITTAPCTPLLVDAMQLALDHERSFYDCLFLALSLRENCPLITTDERLFNAVGRYFSDVRLLAAQL